MWWDVHALRQDLRPRRRELLDIGAHQLGKEVGVQELDDRDEKILKRYAKEFADRFPWVDIVKILRRYPRRRMG